MLAKEQDYKDPYTGESLREDLYFNKINNLQIDHIIPESISFNSNWENLVLTKLNAEKTNTLPSQFLGNKFNELDNKYWRDWYCKIKKDNKVKKSNSRERIYEEILEKKYNNLTKLEYDKNDYNFINSNLSETTYAISKLKDALDFYIKDIKQKDNNDVYENNAKQIFNKIKNCEIRTISGWMSQYIRKITIDQKDRNDQQHHSVDATLCAWYSSLKEINQFYNQIKYENFIRKHFSEQRITYEQFLKKINKDIIPTKYNLLNMFKCTKNNETNDYKKDPKWMEKINNSKCIYSYKLIKTMPKQFYSLNPNEQLEYIKKNKQPSKIFDHENFESYYIDKSDNSKHQIIKFELISDDKKHYNVYELFNDINKKWNEKQIEYDFNSGSIPKQVRDIFINICQELKILSNWKLIFNIFKIIKNHNLLELVEQKIGEDKTKKLKNSIFMPYIEKLFKNDILFFKDYKIKNEAIDNLNQDNIKFIKNNYLVIINDLKNEIELVKKIIYIDKSEYNFAYDLKNRKFKQKITNTIIDQKYWEKYNKNKCLFGDKTNFICLLKVDNKYDFYKILQTGEIQRSPKEYELIKIIDLKELIPIFDDDGYIKSIYKLNNYNVSNKQAYWKDIIKIKEKGSKESINSKSYSSMNKGKEDNNDFYKILKYLKINDLK